MVSQGSITIDLFTDSDAIFEMSIWQCIMVYSGYMKSKQTRYRTLPFGHVIYIRDLAERFFFLPFIKF